MVRFDKLLGWLNAAGLTQAELTTRLNSCPDRFGKPRSKSEINRVLVGKVRFADPFLGAEIETVTSGEVTALDYLAHVAACATQQAKKAA